MQAKESESGGLGWVGLHQHHTSMVPSEGEDGVGWPGLCSLDRGASRRPMIGNQIAAHPSPSSCHRCRYLTLRFRDSPPPRPPGNPPGRQPFTLTLGLRNPIQSLLPQRERVSLSFSVSLVFCNSLRLSSCLSLSLSLLLVGLTSASFLLPPTTGASTSTSSTSTSTVAACRPPPTSPRDANVELSP